MRRREDCVRITLIDAACALFVVAVVMVGLEVVRAERLPFGDK